MTRKERELRAIQRELDRIFKAALKRYPKANETEVLMMAELFLKINPELQMTRQVWYDMWGLSHRLNKDRAKRFKLMS